MHIFQRSIAHKCDKYKALLSIHLKELFKKRQASHLLGNQKRSLQKCNPPPSEAFSWRAVSESSEKFQPTTSRKSLDSVLEQLHWFYHCLVYCLCVVLFG